ncbi:VQ motif-containing protein 22 [Pistacia vera]|uniref:VQ motif-containing protein 22 n=1 Tax=Pistacia vera TaxID=55513 RepID=UPI0012630C6F|nr:VQ motif-containing protein 22 [Pistacia vera]
MSETMSSPGDWTQFYQQNVSGSGQMNPPGRPSSGISPVSDSMITSVTTSLASSSASAAAASGSNIGNLSPDGRVSKPVRRRSRASRRTPTTLLNTDTTNFRAMVQQFTGGPTAPFASGPHPGGPSGFNFGLGGGRQVQVNNPGNVMVPPGYHFQYQAQAQAQAQRYQQQQNQGGGGYMISLGNSNIPGSGGDGFFQRLGGNPRPNMEISDGFMMENMNSNVSSSQVGGNPNPGRPGSNENRGNSFMF